MHESRRSRSDEEKKRALHEQKENERQLKLDMGRRLKEMSESEAVRQERADTIQWKSALGGATTKKQEDLYELLYITQSVQRIRA